MLLWARYLRMEFQEGGTRCTAEGKVLQVWGTAMGKVLKAWGTAVGKALHVRGESTVGGVAGVYLLGDGHRGHFRCSLGVPGILGDTGQFRWSPGIPGIMGDTGQAEQVRKLSSRSKCRKERLPTVGRL